MGTDEGGGTERDRLVDELAAARADADRARDRLAFLLEVSQTLAHAHDHAETLQQVLDLAVPRIADAGLGMLPDDDGLRRVAVSHRDPEAARLGREHVLGTVVPFDGAGVAAVCYRTGRVQQQRAEEVPDLSRAPEFIRRTVEAYGLRAWLAVPIEAGGSVLGVLTLGFNDPADLDGDDDVAMAIELAGRTASGLINAALFAREREVAMALQRSVLPPVLPDVAGIEVDARYLPAEADVRVGGDWYDALVVPDGRVAMSVGDVSGHGLAAGAAMGQLRNALRAYLVEGHPPGEVLARLNGLLLLTGAESMASVVCALVDPATGEVEWASAGHPPMLCLRAGAVERMAEPHGVLLGATTESSYPQANVRLEPGDALVLYTDGLVERRGEDIDAAIGALGDALAVVRGEPASALCDQALLALGTGARDDDVCVLVLRRAAE
jgi:hypothetical protein